MKNKYFRSTAAFALAMIVACGALTGCTGTKGKQPGQQKPQSSITQQDQQKPGKGQKPDQNKPGQNKPSQNKPGQNKPSQNKPSQNKPEQDKENKDQDDKNANNKKPGNKKPGNNNSGNKKPAQKPGGKGSN